MATISMICFANSRKLGGRCIAGLAWDGNQYSTWVRPISSYGRGELTFQRFYEDNQDPSLLDVITLDLGAPKPSGCHVEDVSVDATKKWKKTGTISYGDALKYASTPIPPLWIDGKHTSYGTNDAIDADVAATLTTSLRLVVPDTLTMTATAEGWQGKRKVRGEFALGTTPYTLAITDPTIEIEFSQLAVGSGRTVQRPLLCISISEVFDAQNACYKLIAGVIEG